MVSDTAFIFHIYIPLGATLSLVPKSMSSVEVKIQYQGHDFRKKKKKWPFRGHSCFTNTPCLCLFFLITMMFLRNVTLQYLWHVISSIFCMNINALIFLYLDI